MTLFRLLLALRATRKSLGEQRFDVVLVPRTGSDFRGSAFIARVTGALERVTVFLTADKARHNRNWIENRLYSIRIGSQEMHALPQALEIPHRLWGMTPSDTLELWPSPDDLAWARAQAQQARPSGNARLIVLGIGAASPRRIWPAKSFVQLAQSLAARLSVCFALAGGPHEAEQGKAIAAAIGGTVINLCHEDINRAAALCMQADAYFGNDTGSMHMAAGGGLPCFVVSCHPQDATPQHGNAPERYHPWGVPYRYLRPLPASPWCQNGCRASNYPHCILGITVAEALHGFLTFLQDVQAGT